MADKEKFQGYDMSFYNKIMLKIEELKNKGQWFQNQVSKQLGYSSGSALSGYLGGYCVVNVIEMESRLAKYFTTLEVMDSKVQIDYVEINATEFIYEAVDSARVYKDISVVSGGAGSSKSATLKKYKVEKGFCIYIQLFESNVGKLLDMITIEIGLETKTNNTLKTSNIINFFKQNPNYVLIIDEFELSKDSPKIMKKIREINENGEIGIVLAGTKFLGLQISQVREDLEQLRSRVGVFVDLSLDAPYCIEDAEKILKTKWANISPELVMKFFNMSQNNIRTLIKLMIRVTEEMSDTKKTSPEESMFVSSSSKILRTKHKTSLL